VIIVRDGVYSEGFNPESFIRSSLFELGHGVADFLAAERG